MDAGKPNWLVLRMKSAIAFSVASVIFNFVEPVFQHKENARNENVR